MGVVVVVVVVVVVNVCVLYACVGVVVNVCVLHACVGVVVNVCVLHACVGSNACTTHSPCLNVHICADSILQRPRLLNWPQNAGKSKAPLSFPAKIYFAFGGAHDVFESV